MKKETILRVFRMKERANVSTAIDHLDHLEHDACPRVSEPNYNYLSADPTQQAPSQIKRPSFDAATPQPAPLFQNMGAMDLHYQSTSNSFALLSLEDRLRHTSAAISQPPLTIHPMQLHQPSPQAYNTHDAQQLKDYQDTMVRISQYNPRPTELFDELNESQNYPLFIGEYMLNDPLFSKAATSSYPAVHSSTTAAGGFNHPLSEHNTYTAATLNFGSETSSTSTSSLTEHDTFQPPLITGHNLFANHLGYKANAVANATNMSIAPVPMLETSGFVPLEENPLKKAKSMHDPYAVTPLSLDTNLGSLYPESSYFAQSDPSLAPPSAYESEEALSDFFLASSGQAIAYEEHPRHAEHTHNGLSSGIHSSSSTTHSGVHSGAMTPLVMEMISINNNKNNSMLLGRASSSALAAETALSAIDVLNVAAATPDQHSPLHIMDMQNSNLVGLDFDKFTFDYDTHLLGNLLSTISFPFYRPAPKRRNESDPVPIMPVPAPAPPPQHQQKQQQKQQHKASVMAASSSVLESAQISAAHVPAHTPEAAVVSPLPSRPVLSKAASASHATGRAAGVGVGDNNNAQKRPPVSYSNLITISILSASDNRVTLSDIYKYVTDNYNYYQHRMGTSWQNAIRYNLSIYKNKRFRKVFTDQTEQPGRAKKCSYFWTIIPEYYGQIAPYITSTPETPTSPGKIEILTDTPSPTNQ